MQNLRFGYRRLHRVNAAFASLFALPMVATGALLTTFIPLTALPARAQEPAPLPKPQRLNYQETKLANGLKVVTLEDHRAPVVTVSVWYHVGSKEEPTGKGGFAHLFEHIMFKGSRNVPINQFTKYIEQIGGNYNADTDIDRTRYYETVPVNALDRILFLEADRMSGLIVDAANLKSERDVVKEEKRLRYDNAPYGGIFADILAQVYPASHPYHHDPIGSMADLDAARLTDVKNFHDQYYKPDNATLILVGDFQTADALKKVSQYFASVPKSNKGVFPRLPVPADAQTASTSQTYYDKLAPLPAVGMAFKLPVPTDPDTPVFDVISQILSTGQSSRLYRSLVRDKQIAAAAQGGSDDLLNGGIYFFFAVANAGKAAVDVQAALQEQVDMLRTAPVSAEELTKAKNQVLTGLVFGRLSTEAKAASLGQSDLLYGTPDEVNKEFDKINAVTATDVQRVATKYFAPEHRNTFYVLPASMKGKESK